MMGGRWRKLKVGIVEAIQREVHCKTILVTGWHEGVGRLGGGRTWMCE